MAEDRSGQTLDRYHLLRLLGRGGFAEVYLGQHIYLNTQVAIKILSDTKLSNEKEIDHFRYEAQTIASLDHPNIVRVSDFNIDQGIPFFVLEYAARGSLRNLHPRGTQLPLSSVISYVRQIAAALDYAHGHKQIHRDVKPENILVRDNGSLMLSDFGIATIAHSSVSLRTENTTGTPLYMAPEQIQGYPRPASDQYALAIMAYEWLSGTPPFRGTFTEILAQHANATPLRLVTRLPGLSPAVEQVIFKALAKEQKERFATIQEFALALEQAEQNVYKLPAPPLSQFGQVEKKRGVPTTKLEESSEFASSPAFASQKLLATGDFSQSISVNQAHPSNRAFAGRPQSQQIHMYAPANQQPGLGNQVARNGYPLAPGYQQPYRVQGPYNPYHRLGPTAINMEPNVTAGLSYLIGMGLAGFIFFLVERQNHFARFHAMQSVLLTASVVILWVAIATFSSNQPSFASLFTCLLDLLLLGAFILWLICIITAFSGNYFKLPLIGKYAERWANRGSQRS